MGTFGADTGDSERLLHMNLFRVNHDHEVEILRNRT